MNNKRVLYESIMRDVSKIIKKHLNEDETIIDHKQYFEEQFQKNPYFQLQWLVKILEKHKFINKLNIQSDSNNANISFRVNTKYNPFIKFQFKENNGDLSINGILKQNNHTYTIYNKIYNDMLNNRKAATEFMMYLFGNFRFREQIESAVKEQSGLIPRKLIHYTLRNKNNTNTNTNNNTIIFNKFKNNIQNILSKLNIPDEYKPFFSGEVINSLNNIDINKLELISYDKEEEYNIDYFSSKEYQLNNNFSGHLCITPTFFEHDVIMPDGNAFIDFLNDFESYLNNKGVENYYIDEDLHLDGGICWIGIEFSKNDDVINILNNFEIVLQYYVSFLNQNFSKYFEE